MSTNVTTSFVQQYSSNVQLLLQQKGSKLRQYVSEESVRGEYAYVDFIGKAVAKAKANRHEDTPLSDSEHARRRLQLATTRWADLIDSDDKVRMLIDPTSLYAEAGAAAMGRAIDGAIAQAALGTAYSGVAGGTSVSLPSTQKIAHGGYGLTFDKLREAKMMMDIADVPNDGNRILVISGKELYDLLAETKVTSSDYAAAKALVSGEVSEFLGFKFVQVNGKVSDGSTGTTPIIPEDNATVSTTKTYWRKCFAFHKDCVRLGVGEDITAHIDSRPDKGYSTQVFFEMAIGATRLQEEGVVEIDCKIKDETVSS